MNFRVFGISGLFEVTPSKLQDERGYFSEIFRADVFSQRAGDVKFVQDNQSLSVRPGTIRGIHFQSHPMSQGKLVRCIVGSIFDVAVDLRGDSPTYGQWASTVLTPDLNNQLWIPSGFGHAFCTLETNSVVAYRTTNYYSAEHDRGVAWDDPDIGISWPPIANPETLSLKDREQPSLTDSPIYFQTEVVSCGS